MLDPSKITSYTISEPMLASKSYVKLEVVLTLSPFTYQLKLIELVSWLLYGSDKLSKVTVKTPQLSKLSAVNSTLGVGYATNWTVS